MDHEGDGQRFGIALIEGDVARQLTGKPGACGDRHAGQIGSPGQMRPEPGPNFGDQFGMVAMNIGLHPGPAGLIAAVGGRIADSADRKGERVAQMAGVTGAKSGGKPEQNKTSKNHSHPLT